MSCLSEIVFNSNIGVLQKNQTAGVYLTPHRKNIPHLCLTIFHRLKRQVNYRSYRFVRSQQENAHIKINLNRNIIISFLKYLIKKEIFFMTTQVSLAFLW